MSVAISDDLVEPTKAVVHTVVWSHITLDSGSVAPVVSMLSTGARVKPSDFVNVFEYHELLISTLLLSSDSTFPPKPV